MASPIPCVESGGAERVGSPQPERRGVGFEGWSVPGFHSGLLPHQVQRQSVSEKIILSINSSTTTGSLHAQLCLTLCNLMDYSPAVPCPWDFPGKNTGVGYHFLLQGIYLIQGLKLYPLHCRWILHLLSY